MMANITVGDRVKIIGRTPRAGRVLAVTSYIDGMTTVQVHWDDNTSSMVLINHIAPEGEQS